MEQLYDIIYFTTILGLGIGGWYVLSAVINKAEQKKIERIEGIDHFEPVRSNAPHKDHTENARASALKKLDSRFSIIRRTFFTILILVWLIIALFPFLGAFPKGFLSVFGAAGAVLVGIAARPFLENVIAGYVLTFSKQFRTGDTVMLDECYGTIEDITPTHTVIKLWDWRRYIVPNARMLTKEVIHYTNREGLLWSLLKFNVAYGADLDRVKAIAIEAARESPYRIGKEDPQFWVMGMGRESVECWLAVWTNSPVDAWNIRAETGGKIAQKMAQEGIHSHSYEVRKEGPQNIPTGVG